jgi:hypothetical protein
MQSVQTLTAEEPEDIVNARFAILASIPLPDNPPDDTLKPIVLPPTCSLHEFLNSTSGVRRLPVLSSSVVAHIPIDPP